MKKFVIFLLSYLISFSINAADIVDVFGTDPLKSEDIIKHYGTQIGNIARKLIAKTSPTTSDTDPDLFKRMQLIDKIKHDYGFAYVDFDTVFYPNRDTYTTIEVVSKKDKDRLRFVNKITRPLPYKPKHDLVDKMIEFQSTYGKLFFSSQLDLKDFECPFYHCLPGSRHPKLKDNFDLFNARAVKEKDLITSTIENDPNPERRASAVFLVGHFDDPKEIVSFLTKHIMDPDSVVRNAAMRVINETMNKANLHEMDVLPFLSLLDSPYDTDRNKALYILSDAATIEASKNLIIQHGKDRLISLLRLKQPNNHEASYALLKQISGKDFGSRNYEAWNQWFLKMNSNKG
ncbi:MAG: HEAT repeat domain-containing protein [Tatlockia sp.]|nr:HEAT repeat domain-containing protein [Tatlockia sp.]